MTIRSAHTTLHLECQAEFGMECGHDVEGHTLHPMRRRLAAATSSKWADALVVSVSADGWVELVSVETGALARVWHHENLGDAVRAGEPVALHSTYSVLAVGHEWRSVVVDAE